MYGLLVIIAISTIFLGFYNLIKKRNQRFGVSLIIFGLIIISIILYLVFNQYLNYLFYV